MPRATTRPGAPLVEGVAAARRRGLAQVALWTSIDALLSLWAIATVAVGVSALSQRGDLARLGALLASGLSWAAWSAVRLAAARRAYGPAGPKGLVATARTLVRRGRPRTPAGTPLPRALREEVLGAIELRLSAPEEARALAAAYGGRVAAQLRRLGVRPADLLPAFDPLPRARAAGLLVALWAVGATIPAARQGALWTLHGLDARPPAPAEPPWRRLAVTLDYPAHTHRGRRTLENPTAAFRAPAGTVVSLAFEPRLPAEGGALVAAHESPEGVSDAATETVELAWRDGRLSGSFTLRGDGEATVLLFDEDGAVAARSDPIPFRLAPDAPPEVSLERAAGAGGATVRDDQTYPVVFHARDDYGIARADLVYELGDGSVHRIPIPLSREGARELTETFEWDLSTVPVRERTEVSYYVEVRDNDPGLALVPLPDPPGKVARTPRAKLVVDDDDAEHARNVADLSRIRDAAVDVLAARIEIATQGRTLEPPVALARLRAAFSAEEQLLVALATLLDAYAVDTLADRRRGDELAGIHERLHEAHERGRRLHESIPAGEPIDPQAAARALPGLWAHDRTLVRVLEDEIIRLDDLLDAEILERIETLLARLRATQRKIVDLLEQLAAGDASVEPLLDSLLRRRREDLARLAEARAMLGREIDDEFLNEDALELLRRLEQEAGGTPESRLERARRQLEELSGMHEAVQDRLGKGDGPTSALSEADRARMALLRELSRIEDRTEAGAAALREVRRRYRNAAAMPPLARKDRNALERLARATVRSLDRIDDTQLGRRGRAALAQAKELADRLAGLAGDPQANVAEAFDATRALRDALEKARLGSADGSEPAKRLDAARRRAARVAGQLGEQMPPIESVLDETQRAELPETAKTLDGAAAKIRELLGSRDTDPLPEAGRTALETAMRHLEAAGSASRRARPDEGIDRAGRAARAVREAIDSLRRRGRPPPAGARGEASTAAERDRSLRDLVIEALRGHDRESLDDAVERYYEELLR